MRGLKKNNILLLTSGDTLDDNVSSDHNFQSDKLIDSQDNDCRNFEDHQGCKLENSLEREKLEQQQIIKEENRDQILLTEEIEKEYLKREIMDCRAQCCSSQQCFTGSEDQGESEKKLGDNVDQRDGAGIPIGGNESQDRILKGKAVLGWKEEDHEGWEPAKNAKWEDNEGEYEAEEKVHYSDDQKNDDEDVCAVLEDCEAVVVDYGALGILEEVYDIKAEDGFEGKENCEGVLDCESEKGYKYKASEDLGTDKDDARKEDLRTSDDYQGLELEGHISLQPLLRYLKHFL